MEDSNSKVTFQIADYVRKTKEKREAPGRNQCNYYRIEWEQLIVSKKL
jgi:hypothetical protein